MRVPLSYILVICFILLPVDAVYCGSGPTTSSGSGFGYKLISGADATSLYQTSTCPPYYGVSDLTALSPVSLKIGFNYELSYEVLNCGNNNSTIRILSGAWIDYNQNQVYDSNELLNMTYAIGYGYVYTYFTIPVNLSLVALGVTHMRLQVQEVSSTTNSITPCATFAYGATEEFLVNIINPGAYCDAGPTSTVDTNLGQVTLYGVTTQLYDNHTCPGQIGVQDFTDQVVDIALDGVYLLTYDIITCGNTYTFLSGWWIDVNQNYLFESWERLSYTKVSGTNRFSFTLPSNDSRILLGNTRLRIQVQETSNTTLDPCAKFSYGGTKDFTIKIVPSGSTSPPGPPTAAPSGRYCAAGPTTSVDSNLGPVSLDGYLNSLYESSNCPGYIGVHDLTYMTHVQLMQGQTYQLSYQVTTCGSTYAVLSGAWIDYNQDYVFGSSTSIEHISVFSTKRGTVLLNFTVPSSSYQVRLGTTRLRIQVQETTSTTIDPCASFAYGGTKDFSVQIISASTDSQAGSGSSRPPVNTAISTSLSIFFICCFCCFCCAYYRRKVSRQLRPGPVSLQSNNNQKEGNGMPATSLPPASSGSNNNNNNNNGQVNTRIISGSPVNNNVSSNNNQPYARVVVSNSGGIVGVVPGYSNPPHYSASSSSPVYNASHYHPQNQGILHGENPYYGESNVGGGGGGTGGEAPPPAYQPPTYYPTSDQDIVPHVVEGEPDYLPPAMNPDYVGEGGGREGEIGDQIEGHYRG